jgi:hypothetical protein
MTAYEFQPRNEFSDPAVFDWHYGNEGLNYSLRPEGMERLHYRNRIFARRGTKIRNLAGIQSSRTTPMLGD